MRSILDLSRGPRSHRDAAHLSARDIRAIKQAIENAPTPSMRAELVAIAARQHVVIS